MNRKRAVQISTLLFLAALLLASCNKEGKPKPSKMMGSLASYQSLQTVERKLEWKPGDWQVLEDRRPLNSDQRPPFRMFTLVRKNWLQWRNAGDLQLTFYNDRLMIVRFYPQNLESFKGALSAEDSVAFSPQGDAHIDPSTRVWIGKDEEGKTYVGWIDKVLQGEMDDWLKKYPPS
jgi:hypothetical protein